MFNQKSKWRQVQYVYEGKWVYIAVINFCGDWNPYKYVYSAVGMMYCRSCRGLPYCIPTIHACVDCAYQQKCIKKEDLKRQKITQNGTRTRNLLFRRQMLYHWAIQAVVDVMSRIQQFIYIHCQPSTIFINHLLSIIIKQTRSASMCTVWQWQHHPLLFL